jgi:hypothetical protein
LVAVRVSSRRKTSQPAGSVSPSQGRSPWQRPGRPFWKAPGGLGEQRAEIDSADARHGSQDRYVSPLKAFSRCLLDFANGRAELIEFSFGLTQLTVHNA